MAESWELRFREEELFTLEACRERDERAAELAHERALHAADRKTIEEIERVCAQHGYDPESGVYVADWLGQRLDERDALAQELETRGQAGEDAINLMWRDIILRRRPGYGDWHYPGEAYRHIKLEVEQLEAECARKTEALRPFAAYFHPSQRRMDGRMLSRRLMPDEPGCDTGDEIGLTATDFEAARAALAEPALCGHDISKIQAAGPDGSVYCPECALLSNPAVR